MTVDDEKMDYSSASLPRAKRGSGIKEFPRWLEVWGERDDKAAARRRRKR